MRYGVINAMAEEKAALVDAMVDEKRQPLRENYFITGKLVMWMLSL